MMLPLDILPIWELLVRIKEKVANTWFYLRDTKVMYLMDIMYINQKPIMFGILCVAIPKQVLRLLQPGLRKTLKCIHCRKKTIHLKWSSKICRVCITTLLLQMTILSS